MPDWSEALKARALELARPAPQAPPVPAAVPNKPSRRPRWQDLEVVPWPVGSIGHAQGLPERRRCPCGRGEAICEWLPFCPKCAEKLS